MADIEQTRAVVENGEAYDGKIIPTSQTDIDRPVRIHEKATVNGGVYGTTVSMEPDATIKGSIMANEAVELTGGQVNGEVGAPGKVVCVDTHIGGTVTGKKVHLQNCTVHGNVVGTDVILENSAVLGLATADRELTLENTLCYSFRSSDHVTADGAIIILPQAVVSGEANLESPVQVAGLGELDVHDDASLPELTEGDIYSDEDSQYLTLAPRILNLSKVKDRLAELEEGIMRSVNRPTDGTGSISISELFTRLDLDSEQIVDNIDALE